MSCGAVATALRNSALLPTLGVVAIEVDYSGESVARNGMTVILRWGSQDYRREAKNGPRDLLVWCHQPKEFGDDYTSVNKVLAAITGILETLDEPMGEDMVRVREIVKVGASGNDRDPGFETICRSVSYRALLAEMV